MIGFCTDSSAQLPDELVDRFGAEVVPLTITIDGRDFLEGVDLDADAFYERFAGGAKPQVATAAPSPGQFMAAYEALAARGATEILSVHLGSSLSGTFNSARLAADASAVPVRLVDTGTASFAVACCLWEAAEAVAAGATLEEAAVVAQNVASTTDNVFITGALDLVRAGGRLSAAVGDEAGSVPVLSLVDGVIQPVATAATVDEAVAAMAEHVRGVGTRLRVGISVADADAAPLWHALEDALKAAPEVLETVRYRISPSVGVHTGPGAAGAVSYPAR